MRQNVVIVVVWFECLLVDVHCSSSLRVRYGYVNTYKIIITVGYKLDRQLTEVKMSVTSVCYRLNPAVKYEREQSTSDLRII